MEFGIYEDVINEKDLSVRQIDDEIFDLKIWSQNQKYLELKHKQRELVIAYKPIPNASKYHINNIGQIKNTGLVKRNKFLTPTYHETGYYRYTSIIDDNNQRLNRPVHYFVAITFIGKREDGYVIDHINRCSQVNSLSNLRYITRLENIKNRGTYIRRSKPVIVKNVETNEIIYEFESPSKASNILNIPKSTLLCNCRYELIKDGLQYFYKDNIEIIGEEWKELVPSILPDKYKDMTFTMQYFISNLGRVKSSKTGILQGGWDGNYKVTKLSFEELEYGNSFKTHQLVIRVFEGPPPDDKPYVNHIDGNKSNNELSNLEWCSVEENMKHAATLDNRIGCPIVQLDLDGNVIKEFNMISEAVSELGIIFSSISDVLNGKNITAGGFKWKYSDNSKNHKIREDSVKKEVYQLTLDGQIIKIFKSGKEAANEIGIPSTSICKCANGQQRTAGGFKWKWVKESTNTKMVEVYQLTLSDEIIKKHPSIEIASKETGAYYNSILLCINNKQNTAGGYKWKLCNENIVVPNEREIYQLSLTDEVIKKYSSDTEAANETGLKRNKIRLCLRGTQLTTGGFKWSYVPENEAIPYEL